MYSVKRAGQFGGGLQGGDCMSSEKALFACLFSFPFPHFHDHWYALRGCRNTWWLTGGSPYWGGALVHSAFLFRGFFSSAPLHVCVSSDRTAAWNWAAFVRGHVLVARVCLESAGRLNPSAPPHPLKIALIIYGKGSSALLWKGGACKRWRKRCGSVKKGDHASPPRTMWEKQINSSRQPCDREPHFVMVAQSLSDWFLRGAHTHVCKTSEHI